MWRQRQADHMRRTFELIFPPTMDHPQVLAFDRSLSGLPGPKFMGPVHAPVFETYADSDGLRYFVHIPGHVHSKVDIWLKDHIPGINLVAIEDDPVETTHWTGIQFWLKGRDTQLHVEDIANASRDIRAGFKSLQPGDSVVMQTIIWPARHEPVTPDNKTKLSDKMFNVSLRVGAAGEHPDRLLKDMFTGLRRVGKLGASFRRVPHRDVGEKISRRQGDLAYQIVLNALEFSALKGWPLDGSSLDKLPPDPKIPTAGILLAASNYPGMGNRPLALPVKTLENHQWIIGPTGSGKSALLHNEAIQLARLGLGFCVIEPKGDLCRDILNSIPVERVNDVIYFDPTDEAWPIGLNMLAGNDPHQVSQYIVALFKAKFSDSWGPRLQMFLRVGAYTAAVSGLSIYELKELLRNPDFSRPYVRKLKDKSVQRDWYNDIYKSSDIAAQSITNKVDQFTANPMMRNIVGQITGLNMRDIILGNKILLVPLTLQVGALNAEILGDVIMGQLWRAARTIPEVAKRPYVIIADEFQKFVESNDNIDDMLAMARSYKLGFVGAHQYTGQLTEANKAILPAMKNNASTKITFAARPGDSGNLAPYFGPMTDKDLEAIPQYGVAIRMMISNGLLAPTVTGLTYPPPEPTGFGEAALRASRSQYARLRADVEAEIDSRYPETAAERRRPDVVRLDDD